MSANCAAPRCYNKRSNTSQDVTFFSFPKKLELREAWVKATKQFHFIPSNTSHLCSEHFNEEQIDRTGHSVCLREGAVPSIFDFPVYCEKSLHTKKPSTVRRSRRKRKKSMESCELKSSKPNVNSEIDSVASVVQFVKDKATELLKVCNEDYKTANNPFSEFKSTVLQTLDSIRDELFEFEDRMPVNVKSGANEGLFASISTSSGLSERNLSVCPLELKRKLLAALNGASKKTKVTD